MTNHLNLPSKIQWQNGNNIIYQYNAAGIKISKNVNIENQMINTPTLYLDGYQYVNGNLEFFPVAGAYVKKTESTGATTKRWYDYVFNYTDHLGNIRLSYTLDYNTNKLKTLEENHYYPFGLKHRKYNNLLSDIQFKPNISNRGLTPIIKDKTYKYKYNGKELQDELGLNVYDYGARNYDASLGRWMNVDPLAEKAPGWTPYRYAFNNPLIFVDPNGLFEDIVNIEKSTGKISVTKADGNDVIRLVDNGKILDSYTYGENGSFSKENTFYNIEYKEDGITLIDVTESRDSKKFFEFTSKSDVEFSTTTYSNNQRIIATSHLPAEEASLTFVLSFMQDQGLEIISHTHSHPDELKGNIILSPADLELQEKVMKKQINKPRLNIYSPKSNSYQDYTDDTSSLSLEGVIIKGTKKE